MGTIKAFDFYWGENEDKEPDSIGTLLIEPGELIEDPAGQIKGKFVEVEVTRKKLKEMLDVLERDHKKMSNVEVIKPAKGIGKTIGSNKE